MNTLEKTELTASVHHIAIFLKSGIPIYNTENPDTPGRKTVKKEKKKNTGNCKAFLRFTQTQKSSNFNQIKFFLICN